MDASPTHYKHRQKHIAEMNALYAQTQTDTQARIHTHTHTHTDTGCHKKNPRFDERVKKRQQPTTKE